MIKKIVFFIGVLSTFHVSADPMTTKYVHRGVVLEDAQCSEVSKSTVTFSYISGTKVYQTLESSIELCLRAEAFIRESQNNLGEVGKRKLTILLEDEGNTSLLVGIE